MATLSPFSSKFSHQRYPGGLYESETDEAAFSVGPALNGVVVANLSLRDQDGVV